VGKAKSPEGTDGGRPAHKKHEAVADLSISGLSVADPLANESAVDDEGFALVSEAMGFLKVGKDKVYKMMAAGELRYAKFGKCRRITWKSLRECAERNLIGI
jgi:excisionase family DNA binding protein